jgi:hypothetical protein
MCSSTLWTILLLVLTSIFDAMSFSEAMITPSVQRTPIAVLHHSEAILKQQLVSVARRVAHESALRQPCA